MTEMFAAMARLVTPPVVERPAPKIAWHSFDLRSGQRGAPLVTQQRGSVKRIINEATDTQLDVSCSNGGTARPDWDISTQAGRTMLVALDDESERIVWGGMVLRRVSGPGEWVQVSVVTLEHYFERRFVGDLGFIDSTQATIAAGLLDELAVDGLDFTVDIADTSATVLTRTYADDDDKSVQSALTELAGIEDGIEFTVDLEWVDETHTQVERIVRVRNRIGSSPAYPTQWTMPGCVTDFELVEDYTEEHGANDVMAVSSGEGDTRPESQHTVAQDLLDAGWARFEHRYTADTSVTNFEQLDTHATARLADMRDGLAQLSLTASLDAAPLVNVDWWLGDDIEAVLTCPRFPEQVGPDGELVAGYTHRVRVVGWEADYDARVLTPIVREVVA